MLPATSHRSRHRLPVIAIAAALTVIASPPSAILATAPAPEPVQYIQTDLGTLGGSQSHGLFINKHGQVAGDSLNSFADKRFFFWENGTMHDLGFLGTGESGIVGLNDGGQVAANIIVPGNVMHAALWTDGVLLDLGTPAGQVTSQVGALNNRGQVVGYSSGPLGTRGFLWEDGTFTDLGDLGGGATFAYLINDAGQVAGFSRTASGKFHGFLWSKGRMQDLSEGPSGSPCDCISSAIGLNARGQVVGGQTRQVAGTRRGYVNDSFLWDDGTLTIISAGIDGDYHLALRINDAGEVSGNHIVEIPSFRSNPFTWRDGVMEDFNAVTVRSESAAMNRDGQIVGTTNISADAHGYVWTDGQLTDLGGPFSTAADINDRGMVAGSAGIPSSGIHAVIWIPTRPASP